MDDLADVGRVIAHPFKVLGDEQHMGAGGDGARILHHVGQEFAEQAVVEVVDLGIAMPGFAGQLRIARHVGVERLLEDLLHQPAHPRHRAQRRDWRHLRQCDGPLGDVLGIIADALEIGGDLQRPDHGAEIGRHRLAQRQHLHGELLELVFERIDAAVFLDHDRGALDVPLDHGLDGGGDLGFAQAAHLHDDVVQLGQFLVEGGNDMVALVVHRLIRSVP